MAFTSKLTNLLEDACDVARADGASMYTFILKNQGKDAASYATNCTVESLMCTTAALITEIEERSGLSRKKLFKLLDKSLNEAPITRHDIDYE